MSKSGNNFKSTSICQKQTSKGQMSMVKGSNNLFACLGEYYARVSKPKVKWCKNTLSKDKQTRQKVDITLGVKSICKKYTSKGQIHVKRWKQFEEFWSNG